MMKDERILEKKSVAEIKNTDKCKNWKLKRWNRKKEEMVNRLMKQLEQCSAGKKKRERKSNTIISYSDQRISKNDLQVKIQYSFSADIN